MDNCIFCKIIKKEIPCHKVYEDAHFIAFLDIMPRNPGHTMVVPKKHYRWVWDIKEDYFFPLNTIANALKKSFETDLVVSFVIGDEVPHAHIHLVPRFKNDGHGALIDTNKIKQMTPVELKLIAQKIASFL